MKNEGVLICLSLLNCLRKLISLKQAVFELGYSFRSAACFGYVCRQSYTGSDYWWCLRHCRGAGFEQLQVVLIQNAMIVAGLVTLLQLYSVGLRWQGAIIMGTSSGFIGVFAGIVATLGSGVVAYGAIMGASIIGGVFEAVLGLVLKRIRRFFPPVVCGTVVLSIGLSLISVGINSFGGGFKTRDFGSIENLLLGLFVLCVILFFKHGTKGFLSSSSILLGIIAGYIAAIFMGFVLPTTAVTPDGVEYTNPGYCIGTR